MNKYNNDNFVKIISNLIKGEIMEIPFKKSPSISSTYIKRNGL